MQICPDITILNAGQPDHVRFMIMIRVSGAVIIMIIIMVCHGHSWSRPVIFIVIAIVTIVVRVTNSKVCLKKYEVWKEADDKCKLVD